MSGPQKQIPQAERLRQQDPPHTLSHSLPVLEFWQGHGRGCSLQTLSIQLVLRSSLWGSLTPTECMGILFLKGWRSMSLPPWPPPSDLQAFQSPLDPLAQSGISWPALRNERPVSVCLPAPTPIFRFSICPGVEALSCTRFSPFSNKDTPPSGPLEAQEFASSAPPESARNGAISSLSLTELKDTHRSHHTTAAHLPLSPGSL